MNKKLQNRGQLASAPIAVADLGIVVSTNALGWVTNVASVVDGQMATTVTGANAGRLTWTSPNGSTAKTFDFGGDGATTFTLTEQRGDGAFAFSHRWTYDADARDWLFEKGADSADAVRTVRTKVYDATNRVWRITQSKTDAAGTVLTCESSVLDRNGHATRVTERRDGVTGQCLYAAAKQKCASIRQGPFGDVRTAYTRDGAGRIVAETKIAANCETQVVTRVYDSRGRRTSVADAAGMTEYSYDEYGSVTNETWDGLGGRVLTRHYDDYGRNVGYSIDGVRNTMLGYDAATGALNGMHTTEGDFSWQYLVGSHLKSRVIYPNNINVDYTYEANRDLLTSVTNHLGVTVYSSYAYANDALGRRTSKNDEQYGYNNRSELTSATGTDSCGCQYDDIGNRTSSFELGINTSYVANSLNQYTSIVTTNDVTFAPAYDADGNQTLVKTETGVWHVTYNGENRPVCWSNGTTVVTMDFDSMGRRTFYRETVNGVQTVFTRFFYDGYLMIQQLDSNAPYNVCKEFVWDPTELVATKPLCFRQDGETDTFLTHDGNKNVADLIRVSPYNDSVGHYDYAPFGAVRSQTGERAATNPIRFSSEFSDATLGLVYYNYRHYNPRIGRWMCHDRLEPFTGYLFVENCVVGRTDRIGLKSSSGPQTSSDKGRDCTYFVYAAHGVSDPKGNLWNKFKSRTYPEHPTGDRYGYWGCGANVFNEMTQNDHPGFELPVELPSGDLVDEMTKRDLISRGVPEEYAMKYRTFRGDVHTTLAKTVEGLRKFAKTNGDFHCRCKSITLKIDCSEAVRNGELFYMLEAVERKKLLNEAMSESAAHKLAYDRYYEANKEKLKCGATIKIE